MEHAVVADLRARTDDDVRVDHGRCADACPIPDDDASGPMLTPSPMTARRIDQRGRVDARRRRWSGGKSVQRLRKLR